MIQKTFGNEATGRTQIKAWFRWFKEERTSVASDERSGMPTMSRNSVMIDTVRYAVLDNRRITITEMYDGLGLLFTAT
jgi:hypothetical protein